MPLVEDAAALRVLQGFNPWWLGQPSATPAFRRLAFDACRSLLAAEKLRRAILLSGPRRVGKTTVLQQLAEALIAEGRDPRSILYVSLDHPLLKLFTLKEALRLYHESVWQERQPALLLLDEVQYSRDWETEIKLLVDHRPDYRIVATGSASVVHHERLRESGVGRWVTVPVPTLSFLEFIHIRQEVVPAIPEQLRPSDLFTMSADERRVLAAQARVLLPSFQRYLLVGGFPETAQQADIRLCQRLLREDVVERVLKRDMTALFGVRNVDELEKLFIYLCLHTGGIVAHQTVAKELGTSNQTVANHLTLLEQANLLYCVRPLAVGGKKILKARNKYYLVDAALRNAVLLRGEEVLTDPNELGPIVETTVLRHLFAYHYRDRPQISYWRDPQTQEEVDIIVKSPGYTFAFEVKYREQPRVTDHSGLVAFCRAEEVTKAYWVTKREEDFGILTVPGVTAPLLQVPAHILTYLLGQAERLLWRTAG